MRGEDTQACVMAYHLGGLIGESDTNEKVVMS